MGSLHCKKTTTLIFVIAIVIAHVIDNLFCLNIDAYHDDRYFETDNGIGSL